MREVVDSASLLARGLKVTLELFGVIVVCGTLLGLLGGVGLLYGNRVVRAVLRAYVDVIRGMPLVVVIFLCYYGLVTYHVNLSKFQAASIALSLFAGAHISEIVRGAIASVPRGQTDAAKALGLTFWPRLLWVLLPQSLPMILPPWTNTAAEMVKGTSLAVLVSMSDFLFETQKSAIRTGKYLPFYVAAAAVYFVICFGVSRSGVWLGRRFRYGAGSA